MIDRVVGREIARSLAVALGAVFLSLSAGGQSVAPEAPESESQDGRD